MAERAGAQVTNAEARQLLRKEAVFWLIVAVAGFLAAYMGANFYTASLPPERIRTINMAWESSIPFWPWTIWPYMCFDLLFAASPFLCTSRRELRIHVKRFTLAVSVAVACFLLFPLRFAFERPPVEGLSGMMFDLLGAMDRPYNQAPSLHITLLVILWDCFRRHTPDGWRWLLHLGFIAVTLSVLTTWQHHFLDIPTGMILGVGVCWLIPQVEAAAPAREETAPAASAAGGSP